MEEASTEIDATNPFDRPPIERKYRKVKGEADGSTLSKDALAKTKKVLSAPVVMGLDITAGIVHKASHLMEKSSKHSHDSSTAGSEDRGDDDLEEIPITNHTENGTDVEDKHAGKKTLTSVANNIVMSPINITRDVLRITSDNVSHVAKHAVKGVNHLVDDKLTTRRHEAPKVTSTGGNPQTSSSTESSKAGSIENIKQAVTETKSSIFKQIDKAKHIVQDSCVAQALRGKDEKNLKANIENVNDCKIQEGNTPEKVKRKSYSNFVTVLKKVVVNVKSLPRNVVKPFIRKKSSMNPSEIECHSENCSIEKSLDKTYKINVSRIIAFMFCDATVAIFALLSLTAIPTCRNWASVTQNQLSASLLAVWFAFAFFSGIEVGRLMGMRRLPNAKGAREGDTIIDQDSKEKQTASPKEGYLLFYTYIAPIFQVELVFPLEEANYDGIAEQMEKKEDIPFWSTLTHETREAWEVNGYFNVADTLMHRLLKEQNYTKRMFRDVFCRHNANSSDIDLNKFDALVLEKVVIDPSLILLGVDVFATDDPQHNLASNPSILNEGLRDKSCLLINILVPWANIVVYFELPKWFKSFKEILENEDDTMEDKAIKRFMNGDDEYRNARLKILPCLVEGPLQIRMLVPSKKELTITGRILPMKWTKHEEETVDGVRLAPCLEVEVDITSNGALRRTSALLRNCMKNIVIDLGITIEKPCITDAEEPSACIGIFRFNNIDIDKCPHLPSNRRLAFGNSRKMNTLSSISDDSHT